jgi:hypothetical protein
MATKLEELAMAQRAKLLNPNIYNHDWKLNNTNNEYSVTHTRAMADTKTPIYGKGTGQFLDTENYKAGGEIDINGNPSINGSGRQNALILNTAKWGYGPNKNYKAPDTTNNYGQYKFP